MAANCRACNGAISGKSVNCAKCGSVYHGKCGQGKNPDDERSFTYLLTCRDCGSKTPWNDRAETMVMGFGLGLFGIIFWLVVIFLVGLIAALMNK